MAEEEKDAVVKEITPANQPLENPKKKENVPPAPQQPVPKSGYAIFKDQDNQTRFQMLGEGEQDEAILIGLHELAGVRIKDAIEKKIGTLGALTFRKLNALIELIVTSNN